MIAFLRGEVLRTSYDNVILLVGGVGYGIHMHIRDVSILKPSQSLEVYVAEIIREQSHDLYGFIQESDKLFFDQIMKVSGVGPRIALALLGLATTDELSAAIKNSSVNVLTSAPGVGKRLAERIVVELKDKIVLSVSGSNELIASAPSKEAEAALLSLGFKQTDAEQMLKFVDINSPIEEQVRQALRGKR